MIPKESHACEGCKHGRNAKAAWLSDCSFEKSLASLTMLGSWRVKGVSSRRMETKVGLFRRIRMSF